MNGNNTNNLEDLLKFQINRSLISLAKSCLNLLEDSRDYSLKLEETVKEVGIHNLDLAEQNFQVARKRILSLSNDAVRDLTSIVEKMDISIKS